MTTRSNNRTRLQACADPATPPAELRTLVARFSHRSKERRSLAGNPAVAISDLSLLAADYPAEVLDNPAFRLQITTSPGFLRALPERLQSALVCCAQTDEDVLRHLAEERSRPVAVRASLAGCAHCPADMRLAYQGHALQVREALVHNPALPPSQLEPLAADRSRLVRMAVAALPGTPESLRLLLAGDREAAVRATVGSRPDVHPEMLQRIAAADEEDRQARERFAAARAVLKQDDGTEEDLLAILQLPAALAGRSTYRIKAEALEALCCVTHILHRERDSGSEPEAEEPDGSDPEQHFSDALSAEQEGEDDALADALVEHVLSKGSVRVEAEITDFLGLSSGYDRCVGSFQILREPNRYEMSEMLEEAEDHYRDEIAPERLDALSRGAQPNPLEYLQLKRIHIEAQQGTENPELVMVQAIEDSRGREIYTCAYYSGEDEYNHPSQMFWPSSEEVEDSQSLGEAELAALDALIDRLEDEQAAK